MALGLCGGYLYLPLWSLAVWVFFLFWVAAVVAVQLEEEGPLAHLNPTQQQQQQQQRQRLQEVPVLAPALL